MSYLNEFMKAGKEGSVRLSAPIVRQSIAGEMEVLNYERSRSEPHPTFIEYVEEANKAIPHDLQFPPHSIPVTSGHAIGYLAFRWDYLAVVSPCGDIVVLTKKGQPLTKTPTK